MIDFGQQPVFICEFKETMDTVSVTLTQLNQGRAS
jgi:hypothetical protein